MSYILFTRDGEFPVAADECEFEGDFIVFYAVEQQQMVAQRAVSRGLFRGSKVEETTSVAKKRQWIMHIRADYVYIIVASERASAIEARRAAAENTDAVHESATRQGDAQ